MRGNTVYYNRAVIISGPIFTFCPFYGVLCKRGPSNLQNDDYMFNIDPLLIKIIDILKLVSSLVSPFLARAVTFLGPTFTFCPFYGALYKKSPSIQFRVRKSRLW